MKFFGRMPKEWQEDVNKQLWEETKLSMKTKSLRGYFNSSGLTPNIQKCINTFEKYGIPEGDRLALALIVHNRSLNGGTPSVVNYNYFSFNHKHWYHAFVKNEDGLAMKVYASTRKSTFERWRRAIEMIDAFRKSVEA